MSIAGPILVFLANGVQGSAVVRAARRRGHPVRALVRQVPRAGASQEAGIYFAEGDLDDLESIDRAVAGIAHAVVQVPTGPEAEMVRRAEIAIGTARRAGLRSIVLKLASASRPAPCGEPSFRANAAVEDVVRRSGIPFAIVRPTLYFDNLLKPSAHDDIVAHGLFMPPIPAAQRIAWTCADDCAEATLRLLERGPDGGDHRIAGAESVTGDELAARLSIGLGRAIGYREQPVAEFEREVDAAMGPGIGRSVASKFRYFHDRPDEAARILGDPFQPMERLTDFVPTSIENWARRHAGLFR